MLSRPAMLNVLFIGNSFTARNDLPGLVGQLADAVGLELRHKLLSIGGASLRTHWNKGEALREIDRGGYDYVVLQEQGTLPVKNARRMMENVTLFDGAIKAAKSQTALYMTWSRRHAPETQQAITHAYESAAKETGALLIPVGIAWHRFLDTHDRPELYDRDGSHPSLAGTFLAACVTYRSLFGPAATRSAKTPVDLEPADVAKLERVAAAVPLLRGRGRRSGSHE
jgi:hypothetical protein